MLITPQDYHDTVITAALKFLPSKFGSADARRMMVAGPQQETAFATRVQYGNGPAHSFAQFERGGGILSVLHNPAVSALAEAACLAFKVAPKSQDVWQLFATAEGDVLAAIFVRLMLYCDPHPLPKTQSDGWECYKRCWGPGKPRPDAWPKSWAVACAVVPL